MLHPARAALRSRPPIAILLGNDDGRVFFSTPTQTPTQGLCFVRGLISSGRLGTYWEIPSEASSAIQSVGRPAVGLSFSKDQCPRGSPVPNCRDSLVRFLLIAVPGRSSRPQEPMTGPGALQMCGRSFIPSQPAASQRSQQRQQQGGFLPPAYASQTVFHVVARVRYRRGRQPLQLTRVVSLLLSALGYVHCFPCSAGHASAQFS